MAPRKLSETDKQEVTKLYCQPGETTSTLADKFGVSSSTVSRVLKQQLSEEDYAQLIQWKRSGERGKLELSISTFAQDQPAISEPEPSTSESAVDRSTEPEPILAPDSPQNTASDITEPDTSEFDTPEKAEQPTEGTADQSQLLETDDAKNFEPSADLKSSEGPEPAQDVEEITDQDTEEIIKQSAEEVTEEVAEEATYPDTGQVEPGTEQDSGQSLRQEPTQTISSDELSDDELSDDAKQLVERSVEPLPAADVEQLIDPTTEFTDTQTAELETDIDDAEPLTEPELEPFIEKASEPDEISEQDMEKPKKAPPVLNRRSRRRSTSQVSDEDAHDAHDEQLPLQFETSESAKEPMPVSVSPSRISDISQDDQEDDLSDMRIASDWDPDDLDDSDDYDDDFDDEDLDDWGEGSDEDDLPPTPRQERLEILPFDNLNLQKPCYLVVDRLSELVTCPLKEFAELGLIPQEEEQARTLPVFENHRVARRFSRRNQRIVKVPNGFMLTKTQHYLHAKGITRILFDGQVYALH